MTASEINWLSAQTCTDHLSFPAFVNPAVGPVVAYLVQLQQSQFLPGKALFTRQLQQLSLRLQHALKYSPFYAPLLKGVDFQDPKTVLAAFSRLPLLTRSDLQEHAEALFTTSPASHGKVEEKVTSGSTGQPVKVRTTAAAFALRSAMTLRAHGWQGVDLSRRMAALRAHVRDQDDKPTAVTAEHWGDGVFRTGRSGAMSSSFPVAEQLAWLRQLDPAYILTYPSNLAALIQAAPDHKPDSLEVLLTLGETVGPDLRALAQDSWGVPVRDRYSSEELGLIAVECSAGHYHLMSEGLVVEVLDDDGQPCRPGQIGRVVATDLHNFATALIRYETRDYAEVGPRCTCGITLPTLTRVMGRVRNMLRLPDGRTMWPILGLRHIREVLPVRQFQAIQTSLHDLELRLSVGRPLTAEDEELIRRRVLDALGHPFHIHLVYFDGELPKGANGKFEEFVSRIDG